MIFDESVFKAYDIRGTARTQLTPELARAVGRALADFLTKPGPVAVGRDMRLESAELAEAVKAGLVQQGREVWDLGLITSDMMFFAVGHYGTAGGAMITASHNPGTDDGIKLCRDQVQPLGRETGLLDIKQAIKEDRYHASPGPGRVTAMDMTDEWVKHALSFINPSGLKPFKVAIDTGNGMAGAIIPRVQKRLPLQITPMYFEPDGNFPNHPANPMELANLQDLIRRVITDKLDFGIAFDGDGDRAFFVDEKGQPVPGSALMAILTQHVLKANPGAAIVYSVLCSRVVPEVIMIGRGQAVKTRVGSEAIRTAMRQYNALLGGEHSGHYYFQKNFRSDSGLIAALVAIEAISQSGQPLSELAKPFRKYYNSQEINRKIEDIIKVVNLLSRHFTDGEQDLTDGLSVFYPGWWFNIRLSNTESVMRLNVEADDPKVLAAKSYEILNILRS